MANNPLLDEFENLVDTGEEETPEDPAPPAQPDLTQLVAQGVKLALEELKASQPPAPAPAPYEPPHPGFTPESIVKSSIDAQTLLQQAQEDLMEQFGNLLTREERSYIVKAIAAQPYEQLINAVRTNSHLQVADSVIGNKVRTGKMKPEAAQPRMDVTPIGATGAPRSEEQSAGGTLLQKFRGLYPNVKLRRGTVDRLTSGY